MKQFYKFLMPLVAIVALALPMSLSAQTTCQLKIVGEDAYGDGWNGGSLAVVQGGTTVATFSAPNTDNGGMGIGSDSTTVTVNDAPVSFVWSAGSYDEEVSIWIYHSSGLLLFSVNEPSSGTIFSLAAPCSGCFAPSALTLSDVGSDYARLSWSGAADNYGYLWGTAADMAAGLGTSGSTTDNYVELSNLTSGTAYTFVVWSDCGTEVSDSVTLTFATTGEAVSEFPYLTGFETGEDIAWSFVNDATNKWFIGAGASHTGSNGLYISNDNGTTNAYTTSSTQFSYAYRVLNIADAGQYAVSFDWKADGEDGYDFLRAWIAPATAAASLQAGHDPQGGTSSSSYTTSTPAGWIDLGGKMNLQTSWQTATATPTLAEGNYILVFMWANDGSSGTTPPAAIDNVDIHMLSCFSPTNLTVSNLQPDGCTLTWSAGGSESAWQVSVNDSVFEVTDTTTDLTDLANNMSYTVSVRSICGAGDTSFAATTSFRTPCAYIDSLPYTTSFESASTGSNTSFNFGESCWLLNTDATQYAYVYVSSNSSYAHSGSKGVYWHRTTSTGAYGTYQCLVLPSVDPEVFPINTLQLKFWAKASSTSYHPVFQVGVMTNPSDINTFVPVGTINVEGTTWTEYEAMLGTYSGDGNFVAIRANLPSSSWYAYLDDVTLEPMPTCPHPVDLVVDSTTPSEIYVHWTALGSESSWLMTINDSVVDNATDTNYFFENLDLNTVYTITVAALCDDGDTSASISVSTRTLAGEPISEFPYICGFELNEDEGTNEASDWVLENGTQTNAWYVGTAVNHGGSRSLYISNTNGASNAYSTSNTSYTFAYATFSFEAGEYAYSFDWQANGESSFDFIRAAMVPATVDFVAGSYCGFDNSSAVPAGGIAIDGGRLNLVSSWQTKTGTFTITNDGLYKMVFMWRNDGSSGNTPPAAIDNIFVARNTCPTPVNLTATQVTSDEISVSWSPVGEESSWLISINGEDPESVNDTNYTFQSLNANTQYTITVQADCGDEDVSFPVTLSTRTACGTITLPFSDDFNSYPSSSFPSCWTRVMSGSYPYTTTGHGGSIQFAGTAAVIAPTIDAPINQMTVSFDLEMEGSSSGSMTFGYTTDPVAASDMVTVMTINPVAEDVYITYEYDFSTDTSVANLTADDTVYLVWRQSGATGWYYWLDNVVVEQALPCAKPDNFVVNAANPDSVAFSWNEAGSASSWEIFIDTVGTLPNDDDAIACTTTNYVASGLHGGASYDAYVRSVCAEGASNWRGPINFVPGSYILGSSSISSISMCGGVIYDDGGPTGQYANNADYTLTIYPSSPDSMLTFQGWAYTEGSVDYLRIFEGTTTTGTLLWGTSTSSQLDNIPLTIVTTGPITLKWHSDGSVVYDGFELLINCVAAPDCSPVENVNVVAGPVSAIVTWDRGFYGTYSGADVEYKADTAESWITLPSVTGTYSVITGLDPLTDYTVRVATDCDGFNADFATATFSTRDFACALVDSASTHNDTVSGTTSTNYTIPVNNLYHNTFSEQLFLSSELGATGSITGINFQYAYSLPMTSKTDCQIYLANTSMTSVSTTSYIDPANMTLVYSGPLNCVSGWNHFEFDNSFSYNGTNLMVAVIDNSDAYNGSGYIFNTHSASDMSMAWYSDSYQYPNSSMSMTTYSYRNNVIFNFTGCQQQTTCAAAPTAVVDVTTNSVEVAWAAGNTETSWNVYYRRAGDANWSAPVTVTTNSYTFSGLLSGRKYEFMVENVCGGESFASTVSATTLCAAISSLPFTENFNGWGTGVTPNCWSNLAGYSPNSYGVISASYNCTGSTGGSVYMYSSSGNSVTYLALPELDTTIYPLNQLQFVFNLFYTSTSYAAPSIEVGVMTDPNNSASFVPVDTVIHSGALNTWEVFEVPLDTYTGNGSYVAVRTHYNSAYSYFYMDDVTLEVIPTCPRPDSLAASNATTNSVDLSWHERGGANEWVIEYGPVGFTLGTGTTITATSNPFTLMGLTPSYDGEFYVRSICSSTDTGDYSRTSCRFATTQNPAAIPYSYNFEDAAEWNNWQTNSNSDINWYRGNADAGDGSYSMYISADEGVTVGNNGFSSTVNASAYRDVDFGTVDSSFTFTFKAKVGGTTTAAYDALMVFLVDPSVPVVAPTANITSPWGSVNDLYRIATVRLDTTWQTYEASFDNISGVQRVAFFWFNQNTGASYPFIGGPAEVDSISIDYSNCPRPTDLEVVSTGASSATVTWRGPASASYEIVYRPYPNGTANTTVYSNTNSYTITGLESLTQYAFWVRKICGTDSSLYSDGELFTTALCDGAVYAYNYDSTSTFTTTDYIPAYAYYNYGASQTIIDSADLAVLDGAEITAFAFTTNSGTNGSYYTDCEVYLMHTTMNEFASGDPVDLDSAVLVYQGDLTFSDAGVHMFGFDTTFVWDGHSNVILTILRHHGSYGSSSSYVFEAVEKSSNKGLYAYNDTYDPVAPSLTSYSGYFYTTNIVATYQLVACGAGCPAPVIVSAQPSYNSVTLNWNGRSTDYEVSYKSVNDVDFNTPVTVSDVTYTFTNLAPATQYTVRVRSLCDSGMVSDWASLNITTDSLPCFAPTDLQATATGYSNVTLSWTAGGNEQNWIVKVYTTSDSILDTVAATSATINGLYAGRTYNAAVRAACGSNFDGFSDWSEPISFTTDTCQPVTNVAGTAMPNSANVQLSWNAGDANQWQIEYGYSGFGQGEGTNVTVTNQPYLVTGLDPETPYDFYVRAVCEEGVFSAWSRVVTVTTNAPDVVCGTVSGVAANVQNNSVTVSWNAADNAESYELEYGNNGFSHGTGTVINDINGTTYTINSVNAGTYNVYVRANCGNANYGPWSESATFTVTTVGINNADGNANINIYPNPTSGATTISVSGISGLVRVAIVDMNGRVVMNSDMECDGDCVKTMNVENLAQGAYFVRIYGENLNSIRKLVVR